MKKQSILVLGIVLIVAISAIAFAACGGQETATETGFEAYIGDSKIGSGSDTIYVWYGDIADGTQPDWSQYLTVKAVKSDGTSEAVAFGEGGYSVAGLPSELHVSEYGYALEIRYKDYDPVAFRIIVQQGENTISGTIQIQDWAQGTPSTPSGLKARWGEITYQYYNKYGDQYQAIEVAPEELPIGTYYVCGHSETSVDYIGRSSDYVAFQVYRAELIPTEGEYVAVDPNADMGTEPLPDYMRYMNDWMENGMQATAPGYNGEVEVDYHGNDGTYEVYGNVYNRYSDTSSYTSFYTDSTFYVGEDAFVVNGTVGEGQNYTVTKDGQPVANIVNPMIDELILLAIRIDTAINSLSGDNVSYAVAQNEQTLTLRMQASTSDGGQVEVFIVFGADGSYIGHKAIATVADGQWYSMAFRLQKA